MNDDVDGAGVARGLTWNHPRGYQALERLSVDRRGRGLAAIDWTRQPLEGFESAPIADLAARYDILVLDHPHLGDAIAADCLKPLDAIFPAEELSKWKKQSIGATFASYELGGHVWALPLDAAAQVAASRAGVEAPPTIAETADMADRVRLTLSLAGPHAFLTLSSMLVAHGTPPVVSLQTERFIDEAAFETVWPVLTALYRKSIRQSLNPIGILERMQAGDFDYCPFVFGYVPYATGRRRIAFSDVPRWRAGGPLGSTLGGTGLGITRRAHLDEDLLAQVRALMSVEIQTGLLPREAGQPSARAAWEDGEIDGDAGGFYRATLATLEQAWVRPRWAGYVPFQNRASALLRDALEAGQRAAPVHAALDRLWREAASDAQSPDLRRTPA